MLKLRSRDSELDDSDTPGNEPVNECTRATNITRCDQGLADAQQNPLGLPIRD